MIATEALPLSLLYEQDETAWLEVMSNLAAEGRLSELDAPNLSEFLGRLIGRRSPAHVDLKKGAVAKTEADSKGGTLEWCITPKTVRAAYDSASAKK